MPLYAYRCTTCERSFDARVSIASRDDVSCSECGTTSRRLLSTINTVGAAPEAAMCGPDVCAGRQAAGMPCSRTA